jgi:hypothetical protein
VLGVILQESLDWKGVISSLPASIATVLAAILTVVATVVVTALTLAFTWVKERGANARRSQLIKEATEQAAFWKQWYEAQLAASPPDQADHLLKTVNEELDGVATQLRRGLAGPIKPQSTIRRALLLYKPKNTLVWLPRAVFYYFVLSVAVKTAWFFWPTVFYRQMELYIDEAAARIKSLVVPPAIPPDHITVGVVLHAISPSGLTLLLLDIAVYFVGIGLFVALVLIVRAIAVDLDKDGDAGPKLVAAMDQGLRAIGRPALSETCAKYWAQLRRFLSDRMSKSRATDGDPL